MQRATKIVATLGPASSDPAVLAAMLKAGVNVVRLNFSHGTQAEHEQRLKLVRQVSQDTGQLVAVMADLQGPKIRVGKFAQGAIELVAGASFVLDAERKDLGDNTIVGLDYPDLPQDVHAGDKLLLNDGLIALRVERVEGAQIHTRVLLGGQLSNHKGINREGGGLSAPALTDKDLSDMAFAVSLGVDYIAVSFPKTALDMHMARQWMERSSKQLGTRPGLIAKIERAEAVQPHNLAELIAASEGIMVARGDLAVEVGNAAVPGLQKRMIQLAREANKVVITATQMMESMIHQPQPTRAEVSDVANAVLDGTDAVMLSAETASGRYPVETVSIMATICEEAEKSQEQEPDADFSRRIFTRIDQSVAYGALFVAHHLKAAAIVALTESGSTPLWMSRHKVPLPIYALTPNSASARRMCLYSNVRPLYVQQYLSKEEALAAVRQLLLDKNLAAQGDAVVLTLGEPMGQAGGTNALTIHTL